MVVIFIYDITFMHMGVGVLISWMKLFSAVKNLYCYVLSISIPSCLKWAKLKELIHIKAVFNWHTDSNWQDWLTRQVDSHDMQITCWWMTGGEFYYRGPRGFFRYTRTGFVFNLFLCVETVCVVNTYILLKPKPVCTFRTQP